MAKSFRPQTYKSKQKVETPRDERQKLYDKRWNRASRLFREHNPWCVVCGDLAAGSIADENGREKPLGAVDHIIPHRNDLTLFWDQSNWQTLCWSCHSKKTQWEQGNAP